jgi:tetratricopeptide (TPR) repeat protein
MDRRIYGLLLLTHVFLSCGFTWGLSKGDPCGESRKAVEGITTETPTAERGKTEKSVLALCPDGGATHYLKGVAFETSNKTEQAMAEYRTAISKDPLLSDAHGRLGLLLLSKGMRDEASVALFRALQLKSSSPSYAKALAETFLEGKFYALASYNYEQTLPALANDVAVQNGIGQCYLGQGHIVKAREKFQAALHLEPANETAHLGLAEIFRQEKQFDGAIAELRLALNANPGNRDSHYRLAQLFELAGKSTEADSEYRLAGVERSMSPPDHLQRAASFAAAGVYDKAAAEYDALLLKQPNTAGVREKLGDARLTAGHDPEAIAAYEDAIRRKEGNSRINYNLGTLYERKGDLDEAISRYKEAISLDDGNGPTTSRRDSCLARRILRGDTRIPGFDQPAWRQSP